MNEEEEISFSATIPYFQIGKVIDWQLRISLMKKESEQLNNIWQTDDDFSSSIF